MNFIIFICICNNNIIIISHQQTKLDGTSEVAAPDEMTDVTSDISDIMESEKEKTLLTISFELICRYKLTQNFGIFCNNDIHLWGGCDNEGNFVNTMTFVSLSSCEATRLHTILPCGMTHFAAFVVNIPKVFVAEGNNSKYWYSSQQIVLFSF